MGNLTLSLRMRIFSLVLISTVNLGVVAKSKLCTKRPVPALPDLTAAWLDIQPFMYMTASAETRGVFYELLVLLNKSLPLNIRLGRHYEISRRKEFMNASLTSSSGEGLILLPVTSKRISDRSDPCLIPDVYYTKGSIYIVKRNVNKPLSQLGNSFINGGQIIAMTLILSIISGVFIWILDRRKNPTDFPPSFVAGSWQGFWWAFVTMTTVGYGDTAPKSIPARLYSIVWMLLGMVAFSVLTANVTSSLTHEIESDLNLYGKVVAVLSGSMEREAAVANGAGFREYPDIPAMIVALKREEVNALLLELHATTGASTMDFYQDNTLDVARTVDYGYYFGMHLHHVFPNACVAIRQCVQEIVDGEEFQLRTLRLLLETVKLDNRKKTTSSLFDDPSFFYILIGLFGALVGGGLLWEYFYHKPRLLRLTQVGAASKDDPEMKGDKAGMVEKAILLRSEVNELCNSCKEKVKLIMTNEGLQRIEALQTSDFNPLDGFAVIGNQINSIPGIASIRKLGSELPTSVGNLPLRQFKRIGKSGKGLSSEGTSSKQ